MDKIIFSVSTKQNTTNLIPLIQLNIDKTVLIETSGAREKNWSDGLKEVFSERKIQLLQTIQLNREEDARVDLILNKINDFLQKNHIDQVYWNIGGGQKAQQLAFWQAFEQRSKKGFKDFLVYANQETKQLELWFYDKNFNLTFKFYNLNVNLSAEEIFKIFGFKVLRQSKLFSNGNFYYESRRTYELMDFTDFREFFFNIPHKIYDDDICLTKDEFENCIKKIDDDILKNLLEKKLDCSICKKNKFLNLAPFLRKRVVGYLEKICFYLNQNKKSELKISLRLRYKLREFLNKDLEKLKLSLNFFQIYFASLIVGKIKKPSFLFETMLFDKIIDLVKKENPQNVYEIYRNVVIGKGVRTYAEYDLLIATKWGTLIALDAKTYTTTFKDLNSRLRVLSNVAGRYVDYILVIPFFDSDLGSIAPEEYFTFIYDLINWKFVFYTIASKSFIFHYKKFDDNNFFIIKKYQVPSINKIFENLGLN